MNLRTIFIGIVTLGLLWGCSSEDEQAAKPLPETRALVRPHSPVIGPVDAPVTIVEFFDPSCEGCRAFYPFVKQIMAEHPGQIRLVMRYLPFHGGSEEAVRILDAAHAQDVYVPVLEAMLEVQPQWHNDPKLKAAWEAAGTAGLDLQKAREQGSAPTVAENLEIDIEDAQAYKVTRTPTFFVNGKPVEPFGRAQFRALVLSEVEQAKDAANPQ